MSDLLLLWSNAWLETIWRITWQGSLAIAGVFFITFVFRRMSPTIKHFLWLLVMLKFAVMPFMAIPVVLPAQAPVPLQVIAPVVSISPASAPLQTTQSLPESAGSGIEIHWPAVLFCGWLLGVLFLIAGIIYRSLVHKMDMAGARPLSDKTVLNLVEEGAKVFGVRTPPVKISESFSCPLACGLLNPILVFPTCVLEKFQTEELRAVIHHELAHIKRKDILTNWLQVIVQAFYFFNPLLWLAARQMRLEREQACDDWVLQAGEGGRKEYVATLLKVMEHCSRPRGFVLNIVGVSESFTAMTRRMKMIMDTGRRISTAISWKALLILLAVAVVGIPAYSVRAVQVVSINPPATEKAPVAAAEKVAVATDASSTEIAAADIPAPQAQPASILDKTLVTLKVENMDLSVALQLISNLTGVDFCLSKDVRGSVTINVKDLPLRQVLDRITDVPGLKYVVNRDSAGGSIFIMTPAAYEKYLAKELLSSCSNKGDELIGIAAHYWIVETKLKYGETEVPSRVVLLPRENQHDTINMWIDEKTGQKFQLDDNVTKDTDGQFVLKMKLSRKEKGGESKILAMPTMIVSSGQEGQLEVAGCSISVKVTEVGMDHSVKLK